MVFCAMTNGYFFSQSFQTILIKVKSVSYTHLNAMRLEIPGCCVGYDKIALMGLPVCFAGFGGFLRFRPVAGGLGLGVGKYLLLQLLFSLQLCFQRFQLAAGLAHFLIGGINGSF